MAGGAEIGSALDLIPGQTRRSLKPRGMIACLSRRPSASRWRA